MLKNDGIISRHIVSVKVIKAGKIEKPVHIKGLKVTSGAREAIESVGGKIED